jgi:hypothetical protein
MTDGTEDSQAAAVTPKPMTLRNDGSFDESPIQVGHLGLIEIHCGGQSFNVTVTIQQVSPEDESFIAGTVIIHS